MGQNTLDRFDDDTSIHLYIYFDLPFLLISILLLAVSLVVVDQTRSLKTKPIELETNPVGELGKRTELSCPTTSSGLPSWARMFFASTLPNSTPI